MERELQFLSERNLNTTQFSFVTIAINFLNLRYNYYILRNDMIYMHYGVNKEAYCYNVDKRANNLYNEGKYREALNQYNVAISELPNYTAFHYKKGRMLYDLEKYEEAVDEFDKAISLKNNPTFHNNKGAI